MFRPLKPLAMLMLVIFTNDGCGCAQSACYESRSVGFAGVWLEFADSAPLTVTACDGRACSTRTVRDRNDPACRLGMEPTNTICVGAANDNLVKIRLPSTPETQRAGRHVTSLNVSDGSGRVLYQGHRDMTVREFAPNGKRCGGFCYNGSVSY